MVLSHHGLLEYGSPVRPRIMEAEVLHQIDTIDASMQMMTTAIRQTEPGKYTDRIFGLDNRSFMYQNRNDGNCSKDNERYVTILLISSHLVLKRSKQK